MLVRGPEEAEEAHRLQINASGGWRESYRGDGIGNGNLGLRQQRAGNIPGWWNDFVNYPKTLENGPVGD